MADGSGPTGTRAGRALALLGDHWTLQILQRIFMGAHRYQDIREATGVSDSILTDRLRTMVAGNLLAKVAYRNGRTRYEYHLTAAGRDTWRIYVAAWTWERQWWARPAGEVTDLIHTDCGASLVPELVCGACGVPVTPRDTSVRRSAESLAYLGSMPRRHIQSRSFQRRDAYSFLPQTLELMGDRWNMAIAAAALIGLRRFGDFERFLGTSPAVLSARLNRFAELGMLRSVPSATPGRGDYRLTDQGRGFASVLFHVVRWADAHLSGDDEHSIEIRHDACRNRLRPEYRCGACARLLRGEQVRFVVRRAS